MTARNAPAEPAITNQTTPGAAVASLAGLAAAVVVAVGTAGFDRARRFVLRPGAGGAGRGCGQAVARTVTVLEEESGPMTRYLTRDRTAIAGAVLAPVAAAAILLPFRASWAEHQRGLAAGRGSGGSGRRSATVLRAALAAVGAAVWFDLFFTRAL